ncbi:hypothetical protein JCM10914A_10960 [Paenibacillus sp. JCM 10914]
MAAFIAREPFKGNESTTIKFRDRYQSLRIINIGANDLTFRLSPWFEYTMLPGEIFDERVDSFETLMITGNGPYKGLVRRYVR